MCGDGYETEAIAAAISGTSSVRLSIAPQSSNRKVDDAKRRTRALFSADTSDLRP
jgi:hypothetical protein